MGGKLKSWLVKIIRLKYLHRLSDFVVRAVVATEVIVRHGEIKLRLAHPNPQIRSRNRTFSSKEPDTLMWIDSFQNESVLWDVGANVGLYSIYAGLKGVQVTAIEPSVFNLEFLARNIVINQVSDRVRILPIAVGSDKIGFSTLHLPSTAWGNSQNDFATPMGQSGTQQSFAWKYETLGMSLSDLFHVLHLPLPHYLKIDVDGLEPDILEGGSAILQNVISVLVEIPTYSNAEQRIASTLLAAGLTLQSALGQNQIWRR